MNLAGTSGKSFPIKQGKMLPFLIDKSMKWAAKVHIIIKLKEY